jgi:5-methyltetrahydrofolate--homocysteine methyltransferase
MDIREFLLNNTIVILDGAMGTMLFSQGLTSGNSPEAWNVEHPDRVRKVHHDYIQAGSQLILTNTFGGNRFRLAQHNLQDQAVELNHAAASLARAEADLADHPVIVAGSMGPSGSLLKPYGPLHPEEVQESYAEQARALTDGGVDVLWIETMSDLNEAIAAIDGVRQASDLPITATLTFETNGRTMMGVKPEQAAQMLGEKGVAAFGANCGTGPDEIEAVIETMRRINPDLPLIAKPNAGIPEMVSGEIIYNGTPEIMAQFALNASDLGANLIGACCGSTSEHIQAMAAALLHR